MKDSYFKALKNHSLASKSLSIFTILGTTILSSLIPQAAQAFSIDFKNPGVIKPNGTRTINNNVELDAILLDTDLNPPSNGGQDIDLDLSDTNGATRYSTTDNNIGDLWNPLGIDITVNGTLGLFNSECIPNGGTNSAAAPANEPCDFGGNNGDPDLATGNGSYDGGNITFNTTPQGNLLIREENEGNGVPDDASNGDIVVTFDQGILSQVRLESVTIVDDASGNINVTFTDNTTETISFSSIEDNATNPITSPNGTLLNPGEYIGGENALAQIGGFTQNDVASLEIDFVGSGGFGAFAFSEFAGPEVEIPFEFSPGLGLLLSGGGLIGMRLLKKRQT